MGPPAAPGEDDNAREWRLNGVLTNYCRHVMPMDMALDMSQRTAAGEEANRAALASLDMALNQMSEEDIRRWGGGTLGCHYMLERKRKLEREKMERESEDAREKPPPDDVTNNIASSTDAVGRKRDGGAGYQSNAGEALGRGKRAKKKSAKARADEGHGDLKPGDTFWEEFNVDGTNKWCPGKVVMPVAGSSRKMSCVYIDGDVTKRAPSDLRRLRGKAQQAGRRAITAAEEERLDKLSGAIDWATLGGDVSDKD